MLHKFALTALSCLVVGGSALAQVKVSPNQRYLATYENQPFFWLGDTAWELFHRLTREEAEEYLDIRRLQGYNVIQAVALAEFNGLRTPNRYGDLPLVNEDPRQLAVTPGADPVDTAQYDYWDHVDFIINKAAEKGMYIGLLPTWGDKVAHLWGEGPIVFNPENAAIYGASLASRYKNYWNILWIVGGDRPVKYTSDKEGAQKEYNDLLVWRAMAQGIESVIGPQAFITYHPSGGPNSSSQHIHHEPWLDMNAFQSGHGARETPAWEWVRRDLALSPPMPTIDLEPCYEDHPVNPWDNKWTRAERGYFTDYDVRARVYRGVFAGACGLTYGHHHIWQFTNPALSKPIAYGDTIIHWRDAVQAPGAGQMQYLRNLMLSRPYFTRIADQDLILSDKGSNYKDFIYATRDQQGSYAMIYLPQNKAVKVDLSKISGESKNVWWYNPRNGQAVKYKPVKGKREHTFQPPKDESDWVLVIDDASQHFKAPGTL